MSAKWIRIVRWLSIALTLVAVVYLVSRFAANIQHLRDLNDTGILLVLLGACMLGYAGLLTLLAWVWRSLLLVADAGSIKSFAAPFRVYSRSQIAKYLPGNVFHFVGRQVLGAREGWTQSAMGAASIFENILLILAASACILIGGTSWLHEEGTESLHSALWVAPLVVAGVWLALFVSGRFQFFKISGKLSSFGQIASSPVLLKGLVLQMAFFAGCGMIFLLLARWRIPGLDVSSLPVFIFSFAVSWLAGFVSPGAPGGIGIREAMIVITLQGTLSEPDALLLGALLRIVTTGGDLLFWTAGYLVGAAPPALPTGNRS